MGFARVGSNPTVVGFLFYPVRNMKLYQGVKYYGEAGYGSLCLIPPTSSPPERGPQYPYAAQAVIPTRAPDEPSSGVS
jgi:hypothetical protein